MKGVPHSGLDSEVQGADNAESTIAEYSNRVMGCVVLMRRE